ncbi:hypothetical protein ACVGVM_24945 [Pseudonocardia bannensis]|uniref:Uncharacterized protein n=1 Tax=Pseudonocardia bannensis TaxID=630973 RepID=A0A848DD53_9PSEU|nr:hypothetical protein [Pseudonocardia bannensis]NMH90513.1 hypothetical protein [Pseudonocardia bannensis]
MPTLPTARRRSLVLGSLALSAGALSAAAIVDPFHLLLAPWYIGVLVTVTMILGTVFLAGLSRRRTGQVLITVAGVLVTLGWVGLLWFVAQFIGPGRVVDERTAGGYRLVTVEGGAFAGIDPVYAVRLRAGSGPFAQDALVWQGLEGGAAPADVRFAGDDRVEVVSNGGCGYRSRFDRVTLEVDPVHRPLRLDGC